MFTTLKREILSALRRAHDLRICRVTGPVQFVVSVKINISQRRQMSTIGNEGPEKGKVKKISMINILLLYDPLI